MGNGEFHQFTINVLAKAGVTGQVVFTGDPADIKPFNDSLLYLVDTPLAPGKINFDEVTVNIVANGGSTAAGEGFTNSANPFDVNNDGVVSPIDALVVINSLTRGGMRQLIASPSGEGEASSRVFLDVNRDGYLTSLDVLQVINRLSRISKSGSGEGEASSVASSATDSSQSTANNLTTSSVSDIDWQLIFSHQTL